MHQSVEEHDRPVAKTWREEEDERRRLAKEQEERDLELARKLDFELNLVEADEADEGATQHAVPASNGAQLNNGSMPGSWYRHHPGS